MTIRGSPSTVVNRENSIILHASIVVNNLSSGTVDPWNHEDINVTTYMIITGV
jgi:hypothetical protein